MPTIVDVGIYLIMDTKNILVTLRNVLCHVDLWPDLGDQNCLKRIELSSGSLCLGYARCSRYPSSLVATNGQTYGDKIHSSSRRQQGPCTLHQTTVEQFGAAHVAQALSEYDLL